MLKPGLLLLLGIAAATCHCPTGAACANNTVTNRDGYWADPDAPDEFRKCVPHRCRANFRCERGYSGRMCARVDEDFYAVSRFGPYACPSSNGGRALVATSGLLLVVLAFVLLNQLVLPKHPSLQICFHSVQTVALLRKITYDRDFGQGNLQAPARLAALLGDIALFDVGLFKPTCVASFGFARQLLLQLGVVVVGALVVFVPIYARILTQLRKDSTYRSFARVKSSICDFYKGDFGQEVFTRLGKIFHLVDVQWPLLAYKALCAFRCDADGYLASSPSERCRVQNYVLGIVCLLVFVVPVPIILEVTVRREYELRGGVHAPHVQALFGWSFRDLRPGRHAWRNVKKVFYLLLVAVAALVEGPAIQLCLAILILAAASYCQNTFRPYLGWRLNALESLGCYAAVAACALGVLGIEDNSRYATVRAVDGLVILGVLLTASCSLAYAEYVDIQSHKATPRFLAERCRERHATDIEQRRDRHEPPGPLLPKKKNDSYDDLASAIESAAQRVDRFERRLENKARHAARDVLTDDDYQDLPADVLRDIGALQAASDALNARAFYLACHDPERTNDDLERYVQVARRIEYLISDASFTSSFSASPGARFWRKWSREKGIIDFVAMLEDRERTVVFGFLVRLQRFLADDKKSTALHSLVSARDRPSILYYLLVAPAEEHADCVQLLRDVVQTCRTVELSAVDRALVVPREVHGTNTPQETIEKGLRVWHARRTKSVEALLGEGGLETAQRFVNIEDDCLRASSAVIGGTASPARSMWLTSASPGGFHDWKTLYQDRHRFYMWLHTYLDEAKLHYCKPTVPLLQIKDNADLIYKKRQ